MRDKQDKPGDAGWWARTPAGGTRRIWVARKGDAYNCRVVEVASETGEGEPAVREHVTTRREEALEFLGNDDLAQSALSEAESLHARPES